MANSWRVQKIKRFYGLDTKTNILDVVDGSSLDCKNIFTDKHGVLSKRRGTAIAFTHDQTGTTTIDEVGTATLSGTKYYFYFAGGSFYYSTSITGAVTEINPAPAISTTNQIWWEIIDDRVFFVDGTNELRFFDGSAIYASTVYNRPTVAPTVSVGVGFNYVYTVERGFTSTYTSAESPASTGFVVIGPSAATVTVPSTFFTATSIQAGDRIRVYSQDSALAASYKNVTPFSGGHANGLYEIGADGWGYLRITSLAASYPIITLAIIDDQANLYTNLGAAVNKQAPTGFTGLTKHYGRLVAWKDDTVYNSKVSNPHSWPDDNAVKEAYRYTVGIGDEENIQRCYSYFESLYVFKDKHIYVFGGIGPDDTGGNAYAFRRIETNGIGCICPKSVQHVGEENTNYLVFLSSQGFYATNGSTPIRIGEKIEDEIVGASPLNLAAGASFYHKTEGQYVCFVKGSSNVLTGYVLDTRKDNGVMVGWFKWEDIPVKCVYFDVDYYIFGATTGYVAYEKRTGLSSDFNDASVVYLPFSDVNDATDTMTVSHTFSTGDAVKFRTNITGGGVVPVGLVSNNTYYVINVSPTQLKLAPTQGAALAGIPVDLTTQGAGIHSIVGSKAIDAFYVSNWFNYGSTSLIKKLGKPSVSFDATSSSINLDMSLGYDWADEFFFVTSIVIQNDHLWGSGTWGSFVWGSSVRATPKSVAIPRRKLRAIRYKFRNNTADQDFNLQSLEMPFDEIRNRDNFVS